MKCINRQTLLGRLGADAESRTTSGGDLVTQIRVATTESWKDKTTGDWKERTEWHTAKAWGKLAESLAELRKGSKVYVEGTTRTEQYTDKEGIERYVKVVMVDSFESFGEAKQGTPTAGADAAQHATARPQRNGASTHSSTHARTSSVPATNGARRPAPAADHNPFAEQEDCPF